MRGKQTFLLVIFLFSLRFVVQAQPHTLPRPQRTELVKKEETINKEFKYIMYQYSSQLKPEEILNFYSNVFSQQGIKEADFGKKDSPDQITREFIKPSLKKDEILELITQQGIKEADFGKKDASGQIKLESIEEAIEKTYISKSITLDIFPSLYKDKVIYYIHVIDLKINTKKNKCKQC